MRPAARVEVVLAPLHPELQAELIGPWPSSFAAAARRVVVVPHRNLATALLEAHVRARDATVGVRAVTWLDLALDLATAERSETGRRSLDSEAQSWLVRQLQERSARAPTLYDGALETRGFRLALLRAFTELAQSGLASRREIETFLAQHGADLPLEIRHVLELALAYRKSFDATHDDAAAILVRAARAPAGRFAARCSANRLDVYGFWDLDELQRGLLARLFEDEALDVRILVPERSGADSPLRAWLHDRFGLEPRRTAAAPGSAAIRFLAAPSDEAEADEVVRQVLRAAAEGIRFDAMAVVARSPRRLDLVRAALERCGVPFSQDPGPALQGTRTGRALIAFFEVLEVGLRADAVLDFLSVAPLDPRWAGLDTDPVASAWERAAREARVGRGIEDWTARLGRYVDDLEAQADRLEAESEPALRSRAALRAARELAAIATVLASTLDEWPQRARWSQFAASTVAWIERALAPSPERDAVRDAVARLAALDGLGRRLPTRGDFRDSVRNTLAESPLAESTSLQGVRLGTATSLWGASFELVCLVGLVDGEWPAAVRDDAVLADRARALLAQRRPDRTPLPQQADAVAREREMFRQWCASARRRLVLAWPRLDPVTGATRLPSALVLERASEQAGRSLDYGELLRWEGVESVPLWREGWAEDAEPLDEAEIDMWTVAGLAAAQRRRYAAGLGECAARGLALDRLRQRTPRFTVADGMLSGGAARAALAARARGASYSATQLVTYATCPFRYFLRYLLRVEPLDRGEPRELSELEAGRLVHRILERFHVELAREGRVVADLSESEARARMVAALDAVCGEAEARGRVGAKLLWDVRKQRLRDDLLQYARFERARRETWQPRDFELRFGRRASPAARVQLSGEESAGLHGIVDRVDVDPTTGGFRVVDYKTGQVTAARPGSPQALQLVVYLHAVTAGDRNRLEKSEARFVHVTRRAEFVQLRLAGRAVADRSADFVAAVAGMVDGVRQGRFFPQPGPQAQRCAACDYPSVCDARIGPLAERKSTAGQDVAWQRRPEFASLLEEVAPPRRDAPS